MRLWFSQRYAHLMVFVFMNGLYMYNVLLLAPQVCSGAVKSSEVVVQNSCYVQLLYSVSGLFSLRSCWQQGSSRPVVVR